MTDEQAAAADETVRPIDDQVTNSADEEFDESDSDDSEDLDDDDADSDEVE